MTLDGRKTTQRARGRITQYIRLMCSGTTTAADDRYRITHRGMIQSNYHVVYIFDMGNCYAALMAGTQNINALTRVYAVQIYIYSFFPIESSYKARRASAIVVHL